MAPSFPGNAERCQARAECGSPASSASQKSQPATCHTGDLRTEKLRRDTCGDGKARAALGENSGWKFPLYKGPSRKPCFPHTNGQRRGGAEP